MLNIEQQTKKPCREKKIASENTFKKTWLALIKWTYYLETTEIAKQKLYV
jgi:hypothetical protein